MVIAGRFFAVMALVFISQSLQSGVSAEERTRLSGEGYAVSGLMLGIDVAEFKSAFPTAEVTIHEVDRFCYGRRIVLEELSWATAVSTHDNVSIRAKFHQSDKQLRLIKLIRTEAIEFHPADVLDLGNQLVARYGPYTRMLTRRKMEPAGRIVGFEWAGRDEEHLTVVVRQDHATNSGKIFIETRLTTSPSRAGVTSARATRSLIADEAFQEQCSKAIKEDG